MDVDVLIVGAGPAGAVAAIVLARAGVRVQIIDRARFPRPKLCGDTLNPGALADLDRLGLLGVVDQQSLPLRGMRVTGEGGVAIDGRYPHALTGRAIERRVLDAALVERAIAAGATFSDGVRVSAPIVEPREGRDAVIGVETSAANAKQTIRAGVTIAADGRHSTLAFALGLARHPRRPRRWAIGVYAENVGGMTALGEMHIRRGRYIGIAPMLDGRVNLCVVKPYWSVARALGDPAAALRDELQQDPALRDRTARAKFLEAPTVLGPLAVNVAPSSQFPDGLLLAGDAAGFVDPMTGDGLRFAIRGGELAANAAIRALTRGWAGAHVDLERARRAEFQGKEMFNRTLRALVASPLAVACASAGARIAPSVIRQVMRHASDCRLAVSPR